MFEEDAAASRPQAPALRRRPLERGETMAEQVQVLMVDTTGNGEPNVSPFEAEVLTLDMADYLASVVTCEMPADSWPMPALRAQALAAKSFLEFARDGRWRHERAPVCNSTHCQCYRTGVQHPRAVQAAEWAMTRQLLYKGQPVEAVYSSRCDHGRTRSSADVWGGDVPYLQPVECEGDHGPRRGHAVGMCQTGARQFALAQHWTAEQILEHYYTGAKVVELAGLAFVIASPSLRPAAEGLMMQLGAEGTPAYEPYWSDQTLLGDPWSYVQALIQRIRDGGEVYVMWDGHSTLELVLLGAALALKKHLTLAHLNQSDPVVTLLSHMVSRLSRDMAANAEAGTP